MNEIIYDYAEADCGEELKELTKQMQDGGQLQEEDLKKLCQQAIRIHAKAPTLLNEVLKVMNKAVTRAITSVENAAADDQEVACLKFVLQSPFFDMIGNFITDRAGDLTLEQLEKSFSPSHSGLNSSSDDKGVNYAPLFFPYYAKGATKQKEEVWKRLEINHAALTQDDNVFETLVSALILWARLFPEKQDSVIKRLHSEGESVSYHTMTFEHEHPAEYIAKVYCALAAIPEFADFVYKALASMIDSSKKIKKTHRDDIWSEVGYALLALAKTVPENHKPYTKLICDKFNNPSEGSITIPRLALAYMRKEHVKNLPTSTNFSVFITELLYVYDLAEKDVESERDREVCHDEEGVAILQDAIQTTLRQGDQAMKKALCEELSKDRKAEASKAMAHYLDYLLRERLPTGEEYSWQWDATIKQEAKNMISQAKEAVEKRLNAF